MADRARSGFPPEAGASGWRERSLFALALLTAAGLGYLAATRPDLLEVDVRLTPAVAVALAVGAAAVVALVRSPAVALVVLVGAVYLNLSDVLVRQGFPSLLQLAVLPILLAGLAMRRPLESARILTQPLSWLLALYPLVLLFSTTYAHDADLAQSRFADTAKAFVLYGAILLLAASREQLRLAAWTLLASAALLAALAALRFGFGDLVNDFAGLARVQRGETYGGLFGQRAAGPLGDPNFFAQVLVPVVPVGLFLAWQERRRQLKVAAFAAAGVVVGAILLTYSRGGALALGLVVVLSVLAHGASWRRVAAGVGALLLAAVLLMPTGFAQRLSTIDQLVFSEEVLDMDSSFEERLMLMRTAGEMFARNPVVGIGAANYPARYGEYVSYLGSTARDYDEPGAARYPHNLYLEVAAETGLIGLVVFLAALGYALLALSRARAGSIAAGDRRLPALARSLQIALIGYLTSSLFLHGHFQRYLWLLLGLSAAVVAVAPGSPSSLRRGP